MLLNILRLSVFGFIFMAYKPISAVPLKDDLSNQIELKLRLKAGQKYKVRLNQELHHTGGEFKKGEDFNFEREMAFAVESVNEKGTAKVKITFERIAYDITRETLDGGCGTKLTEPVLNRYKYDSAKQPIDNIDPNISEIDACSIGESFFIPISQQGQIEEFLGLEEMQYRIAEKSINHINKILTRRLGERYEKIRSKYEEMERHNTKAQFSERELRTILSDVFWVWPKKILKVGQSWDGSIDIWTKSRKIPAKYKLDKDANGVLFAVFEGRRTANEEPFKWINDQGKEAAFQIVGSCAGELQIDKKTGLLMRSKVQSEFAGEVVGEEKKKDDKPLIEKEIVTLERI
jgi:hypothetical protein